MHAYYQELRYYFIDSYMITLKHQQAAYYWPSSCFIYVTAAEFVLAVLCYV